MHASSNSEPTQTKKLPATIFSGFLGSGKTTIISHVIEVLQAQGIKVAYIKNEIGDTDIDTKIMQGTDIQTKELLNGCICCTLVGPFASAVTELISTFHPDKIIIEASGAADPSALALMVGSHPELYRDGVISVIDAENFEGYKDLSITAQRQTQFTDLIIFNKVEMVSLQQKKTVVGYVRELNTHSPIIEAPEGKVNPELLFGLDAAHLDSFIRAHGKHTDGSLSDHIASDGFSAFTLKSTDPMDPQHLEAVLSTLPREVFRTKGIFKTAENQWFSYNGVGKKVTFAPLSSQPEVSENLFVFIGINADAHEETISQALFTPTIF